MLLSLVAVKETNGVLICDKERLAKSPVFVPSKGLDNAGHKVCFSPDGKSFVTGSDNKSVKKFDADTFEEMWTMAEHTSWVFAVNFSLDGTKVSSGSKDGLLIVSDAETGKVLSKVKTNTPGGVECLSLGFDGRHAVCVSFDGALQLWDIEAKQCTKVFEGHAERIVDCTVSPDRSLIASGDRVGVVKVWDSVTGECKQTWQECESHAHLTHVYGLCFSQSGTKLLGSDDNTTTLWSVTNGNVIQKFTGHRICAISTDEMVAATSFEKTFEKIIKIWDTRTGECLQTIKFEESPCCISFSPDLSRIIIAHNDDSLSLLQSLSWDCVGKISLCSSPLTALISLDQTKIMIERWKGFATRTTEVYKMITSGEKMRTIEMISLKNSQSMQFDLKGELVPRGDRVLHQYIFRCVVTLRILLCSPDSRFSNRLKLSIWLVPDVLGDALEHDSLGMTRSIARKIHHVLLKMIEEETIFTQKEMIDIIMGKANMKGKPHSFYSY